MGGNTSMGWKIVGLFISMALIVGGLSGELVLRGTNSSTGLVVVGCLFLVYDLYRIATHNRVPDDTPTATRQRPAAQVPVSPPMRMPSAVAMRTPACYVFGCYDFNRVAGRSEESAEFYTPSNIVAMVRRWLNITYETVHYIDPNDWDAPHIEATANSFHCNIDDLYAQAEHFLMRRDGATAEQIHYAEKTNAPYPAQGLLLLVYKFA